MDEDKIKRLKKQIKYTTPAISAGRQLSLWYGGDVLELKYKNAVVTMAANGDVIATYRPEDENLSDIHIRDKSNHGVFAERLAKHIRDDTELTRLKELAQKRMGEDTDGLGPETPGPWLHLDSSNWWEAFVAKDGLEISSVVLDSEDYDGAVAELLDNIDMLISET